MLSGATPVTFLGVGNLIAHLQSGTMTGLVVDSEVSSPLYPDVPTLAESGLPGYEAGSWYGLAAPKGTPPEIVAKLNAETQRIFNDGAFREKFLTPNFIFSVVSSPEVFAERIKLESAKWGQVIRDANVRVE